MLETTEQVHTPVFLDAPVSGTSQADPSQDESVLTTGITHLWQVHCDYQTSIKHETEQFRVLRNELGKLLHKMKELLARPGRSGQWSSFLKEHKIPRATADRLVQKYERSLNPNTNRFTESISEPTEQEIQKLFAKVLRKLYRVLRTPQSQFRFVELLTSVCDKIDRRVTEEGILIVKPAQHTVALESSAGETLAEPLTVLTPSAAEFDQELM